ncbi:MAG: hypothetical protein ACREA7_06970 [Nitrosotalea sp.]
MASKEGFVWLELKVQQKFRDDNENRIFGIIQHAPEFAFFVFREKDAMRLVVRTTENNQNLFKTIPGISVEQTKTPHFGNMVAKYLVLRNKRSMVPLTDLKVITKSNAYQKMWQEKRDSVMTCFVCNKTKDALSMINAKITSLEGAQNTKGARLSGKKKTELAAATQKRDGHHGYYNCTIVFGVRSTCTELQELQDAKEGKIAEEKDIFESRVEQINSLDEKEFRKDYKKIKESYQEAVKKIWDDSRSKAKTRRKEIIESVQTLDKMIGTFLLNSFAHRIARRRVKFSSGGKSFGQRLAEIFGGTSTIDPITFVPGKLYSKSMVLTEIELAFFMSFPQEYDIQTINFGMGPTPTFVHGSKQEMDETNLTVQCSHAVSPDDIDKLDRSVVSGLRVICARCVNPVLIKRDGRGGYVIESTEDTD